jgi:putative addiction module component (TIGR02574 family)
MGHVPSARDRLLRQLSAKERLSLVEGLWKSIPDGASEPELSEETKAELARRGA